MSLKKLIDKIFEIGVLIKAFLGFFEILGGILVAVSGQKLIDNFLIDIALDEIARDPNDFIATRFIYWSVDVYSGAKIFAVFYLILHGVINIVLAVSLAKGKVKIYPAIILTLFIFIFYQLYKYMHSLSLTLLMLILFDLFFVAIILLEYKKKKRNSKT